MENTLYYTFSTIAQSLAGAIAFLGAFVLFRLQSISQQMRTGTDLLRELWQSDQNIQRAAADSNFPKFLELAEAHVARPMSIGWTPKHQAALIALRDNNAHRAMLLKQLRPALVFTACVMVLSVAVLAGVTVLAAPVALAAGVLVVGVTAFAASLGVIGAFVWKVARDA